MRADDALKYASALIKSRTDWTLDSIGGSMCTVAHDDEINATLESVDLIEDLANQFGDPNRYSDGRSVKRSVWIVEDELSTSHIFHPNPAAEEPRSWRGELSSHDPDIPSPGVYEVSVTPATQEIHVRVVRVAS